MSVAVSAGILVMALASQSVAAVLTHGPVVGGVTADQAIVFVRTDQAAMAQIRYSASSDFRGSRATRAVQTSEASDFTAMIPLMNLEPMTTYFVDIVVDQVPQLSAPHPSFTTFPSSADPQDFTFIVLTDFANQSNGTDEVSTFARAAEEGAVFAFIGGDFAHRNPRTLQAKRRMFQNLYDADAAGLGDFVTFILRRMPMVHHWDDHDAGGNNLDKTYPDWDLSYQAFTEYVPTYDLPATPPGIWQRFQYAHVEFFVLDGRSQRDPNEDPDDAEKSLLDGDTLGPQGQLRWLRDGVRSSTAQWKIVFSPVITNPTTKLDDGWAAFQTEWSSLHQFIEKHGVTGVVFISGDLHMGGIDDGRASGFPEMVVPPPNADGCGTGGLLESNEWSEGVYGSKSFTVPCNGYAVVTVLTNPDRMRLEVKDEFGETQLTHLLTLDAM